MQHDSTTAGTSRSADSATTKSPTIKYKDAGVDKEEGYKAVERMKKSVAKTHNPAVLGGLGSFASLYALDGYKEPVLVSGTDGVGTKLEIAIATGEFSTVGIDCFAMCANDILCHGAKPLFFLDYLACGILESEVAATLVEGIAKACEDTGCALVGGETAEMPGFYKAGDYDMAGFCVGVAERSALVTGADITAGDVCIGLESSGLHSNGYSLVRRLITNYHDDFMGEPMYKELLKPTKLYVNQILTLMQTVTIKGMAHITGGGVIENLPRTIPAGFQVEVDRKEYPKLAIFDELERRGADPEDMWGTFNMGIGFVVVVSAAEKEATLATLRNIGEKPYVIGKVVATGVGTTGEEKTPNEGVCFV